MPNRRPLLLLLAAFLLLACSCPLLSGTGVPLPGAASPTPPFPSDTPAPLATLVPTDTPFPTATATPTIPIAWPKDVPVNCRYGPGTEWAVLSGLNLGQISEIAGRNSDSTWWYIKDPASPGSFCWVAASVTNTAGNTAALGIVNPPNAYVTGVTVKLSPSSISLPGCFGPVQAITIKGTIAVNGPVKVKVKWHFELEQGGSFPSDTTNFAGVDSKIVNGPDYSPPPGAGNFWVRLIITSPNDKVGEAKYKILCP